jgi:phosphoethanolamine N-methyltransferase
VFDGEAYEGINGCRGTLFIMTNEIEYHDEMIAMLEIIWGPGFMSPGGEGNIANLVEGLDVRDQRILDIGCGIGGPAFVLAGKYGAYVVGIDIESEPIARAQRRARELQIDSRCEFLLVEPGPMTFPDESFDVVLSSGTIMQIEDKQQLFADALRVLKPGGVLTSYDWMKPEGEFGEDMLYWFKMERLTYDMKTFAEYETLLRDAGFTEIEMSDRSDWYRRKVQDEYKQIQMELYPRMVESLGKQEADHFVENWRAMTVVCEKGDVFQGYYRARKPDR